MTDTFPMGACMQNPASCWRVRYTVPRPPVVRFRYPGEDWQEIEGDGFSCEKVSNYDTKKLYRVYWDGDANGMLWSQRWGGESYFLVSGAFSYTLIPTGFLDHRFVTLSPGSNVNLNPVYNGYHYVVASPSRGGQGVTESWEDYRNAFQAWWIIAPGSFRITRVVDNATGEQIPTEDRFSFKVLKNGVTVFSRTESVCPDAKTIPCSNNGQLLKEILIPPQDREIGFLSLPSLLIESYEENGRKCRRVSLLYLVFGVLPQATRVLLEVCSPPGCDVYPYIEFSCDADCNCKKCPPETCYQCADGGLICCYGGDGSVVYSFPASEKCDDHKTC